MRNIIFEVKLVKYSLNNNEQSIEEEIYFRYGFKDDTSVFD